MRFRPRLLVRLILNSVLLLVVSAFGFLTLASVLLGDPPNQVARTMSSWFATEACNAYARAPGKSGIESFPVLIGLFSEHGEKLASSTSETLEQPTPEELLAARSGRQPVIGPKNRVVTACPDNSLRYAVVGGPGQKPPLQHLALSVMVMVVLVAVGSIPLARSLARPLRKLVETAWRFGEGDLAARAPAERTDELGDLARAFNAMAIKLEARLLAEREMLANVSHELRTPLARVRVVLETAKEEPSRSALLLAEISRDLADLERLTDDVLATVSLDFSGGGSSSAGLRLRAEKVDITAVLQRSIARCVEANPDREVELDAPATSAPLHADPALLLRLFDNLLENARKYSAALLTVRNWDQGDAVIVEIEDRGIGIDQDDLERVFEPFFRSDRTRQRETGGTGLGLALCRRIVELHRGSIKVESTTGKGTTVTVRLPHAGLSAVHGAPTSNPCEGRQ